MHLETGNNIHFAISRVIPKPFFLHPKPFLIRVAFAPRYGLLYFNEIQLGCVDFWSLLLYDRNIHGI